MRSAIQLGLLGLLVSAPVAAVPNLMFSDSLESLPQVTVNTDIATNTTWVATSTYLLNSNQQIFVRAGATLTIEPGTLIEAGSGSSLVVARGSRIEAIGTDERPIVFTSAQPNGQKTQGFWGGVIVLGAAPINVNVFSVPPSIEASLDAVTPSSPDRFFGGLNLSDDSGTLRYVRIEFGGSLFVADRRFNALTLAGVGNGLEVDFVQLHRCAEDGLEIVGGTVNVRHVVSSQNANDGLNFDNGWQGRAQFVVVQHAAPDATLESSNGLESQNHASVASYTADPRTRPVLFNITLVGNPTYAVGGGSFPAVLRRGTGGLYRNTLMMDFPRGIEVRELATKDELDSGNLALTFSILFNNDALGDGDNWPAPQPSNDIDEAAYFGAIPNFNRFNDPSLPASRGALVNPSWRPLQGSIALFGGATPTNDGFFDTSATYVGAIGIDDWTLYWTRYYQPGP